MPEFIPTHTPELTDLDAFTRGYLECVEFTECHDDNPELRDADGFSPEFIERTTEDCKAFQEANADALARYYELGRDDAHAGHDFWLTRNGHGAGFWDRGNDPVYRQLSRAAKVYSSVDAYTGDDNLIYGA